MEDKRNKIEVKIGRIIADLFLGAIVLSLIALILKILFIIKGIIQ